MLSRREFLKFGVTGALLLAAAGKARGQVRYELDGGQAPLAVLHEKDLALLAAIVPVILRGTPGAASTDLVIDGVDRAVAGLPPHLQSEVQQLLALLASWPGRRFVAGVRSPWREASQAEIAAFLERWRFSRWALAQQGYHALHELVLAAWYARPESWPAIGYPGPPQL
jgi:hypothetical protein